MYILNYKNQELLLLFIYIMKCAVYTVYKVTRLPFTEIGGYIELYFTLMPFVLAFQRFFDSGWFPQTN